MKSCDELVPKIQAWCEGALSGEELRALEDHLARCPKCRELAEDLRKLRGLLKSLPGVSPGPGFARRVLSGIEREERARAHRRTFYLKVSSLAALFLLAVTGGVLVYSQWEKRPAAEPRKTARRPETQAEKEAAVREGFVHATRPDGEAAGAAAGAGGAPGSSERKALKQAVPAPLPRDALVERGPEIRLRKSDKETATSGKLVAAEPVADLLLEGGEGEAGSERKVVPEKTQEKGALAAGGENKRSLRRRVLSSVEKPARPGRGPGGAQSSSVDRLQRDDKPEEAERVGKSYGVREETELRTAGRRFKERAGKAETRKELNVPSRGRKRSYSRSRSPRPARGTAGSEGMVLENLWREGVDADSVVAVLTDTPETRSSLEALGIRVPLRKRALLLKLDRPTLEKVVRLGAAWGPGKDTAAGAEAAKRKWKGSSPRRFTVLLLLVPAAGGR